MKGASRLEAAAGTHNFINTKGGKVMSIIVIGIDLAKSIFAAHGANEGGKVALVKPKVTAGNFCR